MQSLTMCIPCIALCWMCVCAKTLSTRRPRMAPRTCRAKFQSSTIFGWAEFSPDGDSFRPQCSEWKDMVVDPMTDCAKTFDSGSLAALAGARDITPLGNQAKTNTVILPFTSVDPFSWMIWYGASNHQRSFKAERCLFWCELYIGA